MTEAQEWANLLWQLMKLDLVILVCIVALAIGNAKTLVYIFAILASMSIGVTIGAAIVYLFHYV